MVLHVLIKKISCLRAYEFKRKITILPPPEYYKMQDEILTPTSHNRVVHFQYQQMDFAAYNKEKKLESSDDSVNIISSEKELNYNELEDFSVENRHHPYHWDWKIKYSIVLFYSVLQTFVTLTQTTYVSVEPLVEEKFGVNAQVATLGQSMFILGNAAGPAFMGPLSDLAGRKWVYVFSLMLYVVFNFGCTWPLNMPMIAIFMFIIGVCGSTPASNVPGTVGDLFDISDESSFAMSFFVFATDAGPSIGGIVGEVMAEKENLGYKWVFIVNIIIGSILTFCSCFIPETLPKVVIKERMAIEGDKSCNVILREFKYLKETLAFKTPSYVQVYNQKCDPKLMLNQEKSLMEELKFVLLKAVIMMFTEPILIFMAIVNGFAYSILFLYMDGVYDVFVINNGLSPIAADCTFLNFVVGVVVVLILQPIQIWLFKRDKAKNDGVSRPEARFLLSLVTVWGFPLGLFWFAFTSDGIVNYWSPIIAGLIVAIADPLLWLGMLCYVIDAYSQCGLSNSAIAAFSIPAFIIVAALAHAGVAMFEKMTTTWAMATLGFISFGIVALVYIMYFFGETMRLKSKLANHSGLK